MPQQQWKEEIWVWDAFFRELREGVRRVYHSALVDCWLGVAGKDFRIRRRFPKKKSSSPGCSFRQLLNFCGLFLYASFLPSSKPNLRKQHESSHHGRRVRHTVASAYLQRS
ncbi:MAG: hypothetical protein IPM61_15520 [Chlorobi bacterium]|nr:hypothetical protein [Chlorobiota bacterium]MBX7216462.1 hypothetical protein [Candidatus Kapabacteria bacterium]